MLSVLTGFLILLNVNLAGCKKDSANVSYAGRRYYTPIDLEASQLMGREVLKGDEYVYTSIYPDYSRF
jgi:hypothetical protein